MDDFVYSVAPLVTGLLLDAFLGDPKWLPHPITFFGKAIAFMEKRFNKGRGRRIKGFYAALVLILVTGASFYGFIQLISQLSWLYFPVVSVLVFFGLANRSLISEAVKVNRTLNQQGLEPGRDKLSEIVGRDTSGLSKNQVRVAVLETLSENLSDGVIAPLFFYFTGGIPLMFVYKMVNTLDSMIGYKNERYADFGYFAAKLDDVLNFIPARITAILIAFSGLSRRSLRFIFQYGNRHSSPNAGYPEAALAGVLNCRFGGPHYYQGMLVDKPYIGEKERVIYSKDINRAILANILVILIFSILWIILQIVI